MKLAIKLAYRNLIGAGLRTWLNVVVLSFSFVVIIWMKGILVGWDRQAKTDMVNWEIGEGQYWNEAYDPFDPFTLRDAHASVPKALNNQVVKGEVEPILITQGTLYPEGRMQSILIKGIDPKQNILKLPTNKLDTLMDAVPAIVGTKMARLNKLEIGDYITLRWRDANGTFDATEIYINGIFQTNVPAVDMSQIWISLDTLQSMLLIPGEATILTLNDKDSQWTQFEGWEYKPIEVLVADIDKMIKTKNIGQSVFYAILLLLALLAIFDTQILSIFRRQKEIGTYVALGYTRWGVVGLFTVEGAMNAVLAFIVASIYGIPFLMWQAKIGWTMPMDTSDFGMAIAETLYPVYSASLVVSTVLIILLTTTLVSFWPSKKIAKMNPTEALRGKLQ